MGPSREPPNKKDAERPKSLMPITSSGSSLSSIQLPPSEASHTLRFVPASAGTRISVLLGDAAVAVLVEAVPQLLQLLLRPERSWDPFFAAFWSGV